MIHNVTGNSYAIKVISKTQISNLKMIDQLRNEIAIMQIVEHKNIVRMSTYFEDESNIYLIMELGGVSSHGLSPNRPAASLLNS